VIYGPARLLHELYELGFQVTEIIAPGGETFVVIFPFTVPGGRFSDRIIHLAIQATADFPRTVPSAIHIKATPQLYDCADSVPNVRNITQSALGNEWRYWSHNFGWQEERSARRLMSQINGIFLNAQ
jgi:hypothetical protein